MKREGQQAWVEVRKICSLPAFTLEKGVTLGFYPRKSRKPVNHRQQPWKALLTVFIKGLYEQRFTGKSDQTLDALLWKE